MAPADCRNALQLRIAHAALADIAAHAAAETPRECCGMLAGTEGHVDESVRTANLEPGTTRFLVDPAAQVALMKRLRGTGREILGAYHSHPHSEPVPSASDIAETFADDFLSVIVSLITPDRPVTRAFRIRKGTVEELTIVAVGPDGGSSDCP
jgi:proteasome lid subunit RPN8/RPN11